MDDDPWANGWSDPALPHVDKETNISIPSWSTGSEIKWSEPSDTVQGGSLWSHSADEDSGGRPWASASSTYNVISLGFNSEIEAGQIDDVSLPSPVHSEETQQVVTPPESPSPAHEPLHLPPSPDAFGSFEAAVDPCEIVGIDDDDPWSPNSAAAFPPDSEEVDQWGSAWETPKADAETHEEQAVPDEWEVARQRKEKMDRQVPPELLASILRQCELLSSDLWPDSETDSNTENNDDYTNDRGSGMEGVEGLPSLVARIVPEEMTLPPTIPFGKTFTAKHMAESIRVSRHLPVTRLSPMSQLMASKGSTAWETSVKSRCEVVQDDLPVGWRVVEGGNEAVTQGVADTGKGKKTGGGLLSFWGRKSTLETKPERPLSPIRTPSISASPPPSLDSAKPPLIATPASTTTPLPANEPTASTPPLIPSTITGPSATIQPDPLDLNQPPPSAVSRFLGRFSRTKSTTPSNQRRSLALSSDHLEFLSDFVPSASDEQDEQDSSESQLDALSSMIKSSPLPTKLPPPLAPPPKVPSSMSRPVSYGGATKPNTQANNLDSLFSLSGSGLAASSLPPPLLSASSSTMSPLTPVTSPMRTAFVSLAPIPTPIDKPLSSFVLPPPPSSRSQTPALGPATRPSSTKPISPPPLLPPPSTPSRTHTPKPSLVAPITTSLLSNSFDDDEFSDFHSPKSYPQSTMSLYDSSFSPQSSNRPLFSEPPANSSMPLDSSSSSFDDFNDFVSSPMRSPSPPVPPEKPASRQNPITPPPKVLPTHQRQTSGAEHVRTADRPAPQAPGARQVDLFEVDFLSDASSSAKPAQALPMAASISSPAWMSPARSTSSNAANGVTRLSPPPQAGFGSSSSKSLMSFSSNSAQLSVPAISAFSAIPPRVSMPPASKDKSKGSMGGLSAQDISFFEGL